MPYRKYFRKYWKGFLIAFFFLALEATADLMMPTLLALIIDHGVANNDLHYVMRMGGIMLSITALGAVAASLRNVNAVLVSQKFGTELRSDLFRKIQSLSFENIDKFERASLITRMTNDINVVQTFAGGLMRIFVKAPLLGIGALILAVRLNPELSVIFAVVVPIIAVLVALNMKIGFTRFMKVQQSLDKVNSVVREYLSGVRVVKAFNRFDYETDKFRLTNEEQKERSVHAMRSMAVFNPAIMLTVNLGVVAIIWVGGTWIDSGWMRKNQVGEIVAFVNYMTQILFSLMTISMVFNMFVRARASTTRIGEVFLQENSMTWKEPSSGDDVVVSGRIDFEGVDFAYAGTSGPPVLKNVSFTCLPGETVGIIGSTGSGKSSLVGLIPRFYDATAGHVRIDGKDVRDIDPAVLRKRIAIVPQKSVLFSGTVMQNIRWGDEQATEEEVKQAAKMAEAHGFITQLPEGYQSRLGQRGVNLSGGQKQRISIARALIRKPRILILDDCTSAVDTATEIRIKEALKTYAKNLTCIMIAQRITSVMDADKIVVMDQGEVVGIGTHQALMKECKVYREIFQSQIGKELQANVQAN
ncbi:ABC transporter ATP-binding protein [Paenibacillus alkalitolerans]|uniref:ABC transporter ATP-binding protein n=1 Tax=Paenibacillus alkalitolerans TaxID=2799335 RepID=UPI0018F58A0C|nr:ABC transporter ATP-binding protein [Paenibacillus alkalitolerans]